MKRQDRSGTLPLTRRDLLRCTVAASAAALVPTQLSAQEPIGASDNGVGDTLIASSQEPIAQTSYGNIRGSIDRGVYMFKGIPYGSDTSGTRRFLSPLPPQAWAGTRSCMYYGPVCPQPPRAAWAHDEEAWFYRWDDGVQGEDCLRLNIWSGGLHDGGKRPVMVWLHGGGFSDGSSQEFPSYDGANLARKHGVVVVSVNHRLNLMGHLNLSEFDERFKDSANVGMLDLVAALQWVRLNIAAFGGTPDSVTVFGQSGGGGKVLTLMTMPSAAGLFHRAIVESGSMLKLNTPAQSRAMARLVVQHLGLKNDVVEQLQQLEPRALQSAAEAAVPRLKPLRSGSRDWRPRISSHPWGPTVDGTVIPEQPFGDTAPSTSADVPLLIGSTLNEFVHAVGHPEYYEMHEEQLVEAVSEVWGSKAQSIVAVFRDRHPRDRPFQLWSRIASAPIRQWVLDQAGLKAAQRRAPVYCYWFWWQSPVLDGRPMAFHTSEISFAFLNTDRCATMTGGGLRARSLADKVSGAWSAFARHGNPNHSELPQWQALTEGNAATMVFDDRSFCGVDIDRPELEAIRG
jgi:para-nitrobenzyl esterase